MAISKPNEFSNGQSKKTYYELAKSCHPDLNPNDLDATEKFQKLQTEYKKVANSPKINEKTYCISSIISLQDSILGCTRYFSSHNEQRRFILKIPPGIKNNDIIRYKNIQMDNDILSILEVKINVEYPENYSYKNGRLMCSVLVPFWKMLFGGEKTIIGPDKMRIKILIPPRTKSGSIFEIQNEGLFDKLTKKRNILHIRLTSAIFG